MFDADRILGVYLHLARASALRQQPMVRDKLLVLAGVQAEEMGLEPISALCRHRILSHNTRHLVSQWPTFMAALADERFQTYLKQLKRRYSAEKTEHMLASLGIELGRERDAYYSDLEYAAALLDTKPEAIGDILNAETRKTQHGSSDDSVDRSPGNRGEKTKSVEIVHTGQQLPHMLIVWGPWMVGCSILAALAAYSGFLSR